MFFLYLFLFNLQFLFWIMYKLPLIWICSTLIARLFVYSIFLLLYWFVENRFRGNNNLWLFLLYIWMTVLPNLNIFIYCLYSQLKIIISLPFLLFYSRNYTVILLPKFHISFLWSSPRHEGCFLSISFSSLWRNSFTMNSALFISC